MTINSRNTKAEILAAYKDLEKQKRILESEVKKRPQTNPVVNNDNSSNPAKKIQISNTKDMLNTIQNLEEIQRDFGGVVGSLSEQLITEATQLESVRQEIAKEKVELENLHELSEIEESTIDILLEQYQASAKKFTEESSQQQESSEQEITELKQAWAKEQEANTRLIKTRNEDYRKS